jgi:hypothetical protein
MAQHSNSQDIAQAVSVWPLPNYNNHRLLRRHNYSLSAYFVFAFILHKQ